MYPEEMLLGFLAKKVGRPVRWTPTRSQDMTGLGHSRNQRHEVKITGKADGTITALDAHIITDSGAYPVAAAHMAKNTGTMLPGPLDIPQVTWRMTALVTNTTPMVAYRGAGRPESGALLDRAVDLFAAEIGMDPLDVRRKNTVPANKMPHTNPSGVVYDSGDFTLALEQVAEHVGWDDIRQQQASQRAAGSTKILGIGLSTFIDRTAGVAGTEYGSLQLNADGSMKVLTGSSPYGQGHYTTWAQLVSERTGVPMDRIEIFHGDTDVVPRGGITGGSRSAQKAGSAVAMATDQLVAEASKFAADMLEAAPGDVVIDTVNGQFHVAGSPGAASVTWTEIAAARIEAADGEDDQIAFACETDFDTDGPSVPYGAYAARCRASNRTSPKRRHPTIRWGPRASPNRAPSAPSRRSKTPWSMRSPISAFATSTCRSPHSRSGPPCTPNRPGSAPLVAFEDGVALLDEGLRGLFVILRGASVTMVG